MKKHALLAAAVLALFCSGCAYPIWVVAHEEPDAPGPLAPAMTIAVYDHEPKDEDADMRRQLADKIERLLKERGYRLVAPEDAELLLFFSYDRESTFRKVVIQSTPGVTGGIHSVRVNPPYNHSLVVRVVKGTDYREQKVSTSFWVGEAVLNKTDIGGPKIADLLLVAVFDYFGKTTDAEVKVPLGIENKRARALRSP